MSHPRYRARTLVTRMQRPVVVLLAEILLSSVQSRRPTSQVAGDPPVAPGFMLFAVSGDGGGIMAAPGLCCC